ncbi:GvpL/GvpF family gas vesicle protein [Actinomycetospora termitidis]|uniref:GvpL/GvpF family gas vesicle protein n=1 Tax=Actinomycetospora termitidis TaxID=3053470 RepID=A0ABT7M8P5_9PSEU|nr:GvpL/GvpF family gas vesicle protein [Actinomycetospora sp. Odt1-22]MDL5156963.1 GvpL/GvpF family gas vesicle protein [Actinomycetospora sp. Odt1-22]
MITYLYAVGRDLSEIPDVGSGGVGGGALRLVGEAGLQAIVSDVEREAFEDLDEHREDLAWLATVARAHHGVVEAAGREHAIAPLALATVYLDDDRVRAVLREGHEAFTAVLDRITDRDEWGVKAFMRPSSASGSGSGPERPTSGAAYLRARRTALREGDAAVTEAERVADEIDAALADLAVAARRHAPQDRSLTGRSERMVLNGAYLVDRSAADDLRALVGRLAEDRRLDLELTGPWVPYSFAGGAT